MPDLSVLIPARNEEWLARTISDVLAHARADTEVIAVLDGAWADPQIPDHPKVRLTHSAGVIGQRAATNLAARMSTAKYVMKADAHCSFDEGFDVKLIQADEELGRPDVTQIPAMYNLHCFNWRCQACGTETYQGPLPTLCATCAGSSAKTPGGPFERLIIWDRRRRKFRTSKDEGSGGYVRTEFWRFDHMLHFMYGGPVVKGQEKTELADVMSSVGACFFMRRDRFIEIGGLDERHGSWGNVGVEVACKSWLSGGRQIVNRRTYFSHLFRTRADFSFPYLMRGTDQERAREYSRRMWYGNAWPLQTRPLSWLIEYFAPIKGWHDADGAARLRDVMAAGAGCDLNGDLAEDSAERLAVKMGDGEILRISHAVPPCQVPGWSGAAGVDASSAPPILAKSQTKGLLYYSDLRGDPRILSAVREQIRRAAPDLPVVSVTLQPVAFGRNIVLPLERGPLTMFKQILAGLEALDTDIVFHCEHDCLYSPDHFMFTPPRDDTFYYNHHRWQVSAEDGRAVHYRAGQTAQLCACRSLLIEHYRKRIAAVEAAGGYERNMGFEPGTNRWSRSIDPHGAEAWFSTVPNIDIRHGKNLSKTRWSPSEFRNKSTCLGWTESDRVPGWGITRGRFWEFLASLGNAAETRRSA